MQTKIKNNPALKPGRSARGVHFILRLIVLLLHFGLCSKLGRPQPRQSRKRSSYRLLIYLVLLLAGCCSYCSTSNIIEGSRDSQPLSATNSSSHPFTIPLPLQPLLDPPTTIRHLKCSHSFGHSHSQRHLVRQKDETRHEYAP